MIGGIKIAVLNSDGGNMFRRIMVPIDLSDARNPALLIAKRIARQNKSQMTLLHVIEKIKFLPSNETKNFYIKLKKTGAEKLQKIADSLKSENKIHSEIILGNRASSIVSYAINNGIDLIVMNSHRVDLKEPTKGWGTISYKVAILSQCPVLLVK
jgi:nucleotide-binding universal stress UspA family protein